MSSEEHLKELLESENQHISRLNEIVLESIKEEELITQKIYESPDEEKLSFGDRVADKVADFGGIWRFIIIFSVCLAAWISINTFLFLSHPFDPYPFILLNLILSFIAALQAPVIMMSQNRKEDKDRKRAENDYLVNLKAELEIRNLHRKIDLLIKEEFDNLSAVQKIQLEMLEEIQKKLIDPSAR